MQEFGLTPGKSGYSSDYNGKSDPSISNEFAAAAFRIGHTLLTPNIPGRDESGRNTTFLELREAFNTGEFLQEKSQVQRASRREIQEGRTIRQREESCLHLNFKLKGNWHPHSLGDLAL